MGYLDLMDEFINFMKLMKWLIKIVEVDNALIIACPLQVLERKVSYYSDMKLIKYVGDMKKAIQIKWMKKMKKMQWVITIV